MTEGWQLVLPECWRVELMRAPALWRRWREQIAASPVPFSVLDWEDQLGPRLLVAALDLSTAELLLKLPAGTRVVGLSNRLEQATRLGRGVDAMLDRARACAVTWVEPAHRPVRAPFDLLAYLEPALARAAETA